MTLLCVLLVLSGCSGDKGRGVRPGPVSLDPPFFALMGRSSGFQEALGLALSADAAVAFFTARRLLDDAPVVYRLDTRSGVLSELFAGAPLIEPGALTLSPDGKQLVICDVAAQVPGPLTGTVFRMSVGGGLPVAILDGTVIDHPSGVVFDAFGRNLFVSGVNAAGEGAVYIVGLAGGRPLVLSVGSPLDDPTALELSADGGTLLVLDASGAADGNSAVLEIPSTGGRARRTITGFRGNWPCGIAQDAAFTKVFTAGTRLSTMNPTLLSFQRPSGPLVDVLVGGPMRAPACVATAPLFPGLLMATDAEGFEGGGVFTAFE